MTQTPPTIGPFKRIVNVGWGGGPIVLIEGVGPRNDTIPIYFKALDLELDTSGSLDGDGSYAPGDEIPDTDYLRHWVSIQGSIDTGPPFHLPGLMFEFVETALWAPDDYPIIRYDGNLAIGSGGFVETTSTISGARATCLDPSNSTFVGSLVRGALNDPALFTVSWRLYPADTTYVDDGAASGSDTTDAVRVTQHHVRTDLGTATFLLNMKRDAGGIDPGPGATKLFSIVQRRRPTPTGLPPQISTYPVSLKAYTGGHWIVSIDGQRVTNVGGTLVWSETLPFVTFDSSEHELARFNTRGITP